MAAENNAGEIRLGVGLSTDPLQEQAKSVEKTAEKVGKSIGEAVDKGSTESLKKTSEMSDSEIIRACHFYVEENGLMEEWEAFRESNEKQAEEVFCKQ